MERGQLGTGSAAIRTTADEGPGPPPDAPRFPAPPASRRPPPATPTRSCFPNSCCRGRLRLAAGGWPGRGLAAQGGGLGPRVIVRPPNLQMGSPPRGASRPEAVLWCRWARDRRE